MRKIISLILFLACMNISCNKANKERIIAETIGQQIELDFYKTKSFQIYNP